jgi:hypothetical protein
MVEVPQASTDAAVFDQGTAGGTDITSALKGITLALAALVEAMGGTSASGFASGAAAQQRTRRR